MIYINSEGTQGSLFKQNLMGVSIMNFTNTKPLKAITTVIYFVIAGIITVQVSADHYGFVKGLWLLAYIIPVGVFMVAALFNKELKRGVVATIKSYNWQTRAYLIASTFAPPLVLFSWILMVTVVTHLMVREKAVKLSNV